MTDEHAAAAAVIEAARELVALFRIEIVANRKTGEAWLEVTNLTNGSMRRIKPDDTRKDVYFTAAQLSAAIEAYDEQRAEDEG